MAIKPETTKHKVIPGSDTEFNDIFTFPFTVDDATIDFLEKHGRIMFIIRGPPGTAKDSLTRMLTENYSTAYTCSADSYFSDTFSSSKRNKESLRLSHEFCHRKVETACKKNKHPIIVKNTHMTKFEMQKYLDFAAEFNYTVIMAVTIHKMEVTPEILAQSNTKGLSVEYFRRRLSQWVEVIPVMLGWFLSPDDSSYLLNELQNVLYSLLGDGRFCRVLNVYDNGSLLEYYNARKLLYCTAACGEGKRHEMKFYYLSNKVQENYGKCFTIFILGYLVTPSFVSAVVYLNENMKSLQLISKSAAQHDDDVDSLVERLSSLAYNDNLKKHSVTIDFSADFKSNQNTAEKENCDEVINVNHCNFILLAESVNEPHLPFKPVHLLMKLLRSAADANGVISPDKFVELDENVKVCRLSESAWLIRPAYNLSFKTVYTGLYI